MVVGAEKLKFLECRNVVQEFGQFASGTSIFAMMKIDFKKVYFRISLGKGVVCHVNDLPGFSTAKYFLASMQSWIRSHVTWYSWLAAATRSARVPDKLGGPFECSSVLRMGGFQLVSKIKTTPVVAKFYPQQIYQTETQNVLSRSHHSRKQTTLNTHTVSLTRA